MPKLYIRIIIGLALIVVLEGLSNIAAHIQCTL